MSKRGPRKSALLIGIDRYDSDWVLDLSGCSEDVSLLESYLKESVRIPKISKLTSFASSGPRPFPTDGLPNLRNVVNAFEKLAFEAQENDFIFIHYSGHGTRLPTCFPTLKGDSQDEGLLLVREGDRRVDFLRDVELAYLLKQIVDKGAFVTIVLDCCHSGGAVRGESAPRGVDNLPESAVVLHDPVVNPAALDALKASRSQQISGSVRGASVVRHWLTSPSTGIEFLGACLANQKAQEIKHADNKWRGLLTECLLGVLQENHTRMPELTCDMIYRLVQRKVAAHPKSTMSQDVVFEGETNRDFFGVGLRRPPATFAESVLAQSNGDFWVQLNAGHAHGVLANDEFALYSADKVFSTISDYNGPLAVCKVTQVNDFVAQGSVTISAGQSIGAGCKAVMRREILRRHVLSPRTVRISSDEDVQAQSISIVAEMVRTECKLINLSTSQSTFFQVHLRKSEHFEITFNEAGKLDKTIINVYSKVDLLSHLAHLAIYYNLLNLNGASSSTGLLVEKTGFLPYGIDPPGPLKPGSDAPPTVEGLEQLVTSDPQNIKDGDSIGIRVRNTSFKPVFIEVLNLEPSWQVSRIYPFEENAPIQLLPNETVDFFLSMFISAHVPYSVQPDRCDALIFLATTSNIPNFPREVLPQLDQISSCQSSLFRESGNGRGAKGIDSAQWFVQRVDVRVGNSR